MARTSLSTDAFPRDLGVEHGIVFVVRRFDQETIGGAHIQPFDCLCYTRDERLRRIAKGTFAMTGHSNASEGAIFSRVLDGARPTLSRAAAKAFLNFGFSQTDKDRMAELSVIAREGTLSAEEQVEINNYERVGHILALMKLRARRTLEGVSETKRKAKTH
jgi:hypothetical protein